MKTHKSKLHEKLVDLRTHYRNQNRTSKRVRGTPANSDATPQQPEKDRKSKLREAFQRCSSLARQPDILSAFVTQLKANGVAGEKRNAEILFLVVLTRFLDEPASVVVKGPSGGGKSFLVESVLKFFPSEAYFSLTSMSEKALIYSRESLVHRMLVICEAAGIPSAKCDLLVRTLLSEHFIKYEVVLPDRTTEVRKRPGPTGLIQTTTAEKLHPENETRMLSLKIRTSHEHTKAVLLAVATEQPPTIPQLEHWHALHQWLALGPTNVRIPFSKCIAENVNAIDVRLSRSFSIVLNLVKAHALLHRKTRRRTNDGLIVAELQDYEAVWKLVKDIVAENIEAGVAPSVRETVQAVCTLHKGGKHVSLTSLSEHLDLHKSTVSRRVAEAISLGYVNNLESRDGRTAKLVPGEPLPEDIEILPSPKTAAVAYARTAKAHPKQHAISKRKKFGLKH